MHGQQAAHHRVRSDPGRQHQADRPRRARGLYRLVGRLTMADLQPVYKDVETKMTGALDALGREFAAVRTGRASANLLDGIRVDYYGTPTPVNQLASVSAPHPPPLLITPSHPPQ